MRLALFLVLAVPLCASPIRIGTSRADSIPARFAETPAADYAFAEGSAGTLRNRLELPPVNPVAPDHTGDPGDPGGPGHGEVPEPGTWALAAGAAGLFAFSAGRRTGRPQRKTP